MNIKNVEKYIQKNEMLCGVVCVCDFVCVCMYMFVVHPLKCWYVQKTDGAIHTFHHTYLQFSNPEQKLQRAKTLPSPLRVAAAFSGESKAKYGPATTNPGFDLLQPLGVAAAIKKKGVWWGHRANTWPAWPLSPPTAPFIQTTKAVGVLRKPNFL